MAVVLDSLTATAARTVFTKPPDLARMFSPLPRALVNFSILNGVISIKPLNDTAELVVSISLDPTFAYRLVELSASMIQDTARDWNALTFLEITNAIRNLVTGATQRHTFLKSNGTHTPTPTEMWCLGGNSENLPRYIMQLNRAAPVITFKANNDTAAASVAGTFNFHAAFMEYEIEQVEAYFLHYPVLTLSR